MSGRHLVAAGPTLRCLAVAAAVGQPVRVYDLATPHSAAETIDSSVLYVWIIVCWCALHLCD